MCKEHIHIKNECHKFEKHNRGFKENEWSRRSLLPYDTILVDFH